MKETYIALIIEQLHKCDDIPLLNLIYQLLTKSIKETTQTI